MATERTEGGRVGQVTNIDPEQLAEKTREILDQYGLVSEQAIKEAVDEITKETVKVIKEAGAYKSHRHKTGTKSYKQCITSKRIKEGQAYAKAVWAGEEKYFVSHLLEKGHKVTGAVTKASRTRAFPHFAAGDLYVSREFEKRVLAKLEKLGG